MSAKMLAQAIATVGTMMVHRQYGTCIVQEPTHRDDVGPLVNVTLYPAVQNCRISIPKHRIEESLRCVASPAIAKKIYAVLGEKPKPRSVHQRLVKRTQDDLHSGDPLRIAEVLRDLYTIDECGYDRFMLITTAFELLVHELGYVLEKPAPVVQQELINILKSVRLPSVV